VYDQDAQITQDRGNRRGVLKIGRCGRALEVEYLLDSVNSAAAAAYAPAVEIGYYLNAANSRQKVELLP